MRLGLYQHYKGQHYQVLGLGRHSESLEEYVVYQALYGDFGLWVRPLSLFTSTVLVDGLPKPRFLFVRELGVDAPMPR